MLFIHLALATLAQQVLAVPVTPVTVTPITNAPSSRPTTVHPITVTRVNPPPPPMESLLSMINQTWSHMDAVIDYSGEWNTSWEYAGKVSTSNHTTVQSGASFAFEFEGVGYSVIGHLEGRANVTINGNSTELHTDSNGTLLQHMNTTTGMLYRVNVTLLEGSLTLGSVNIAVDVKNGRSPTYVPYYVLLQRQQPSDSKALLPISGGPNGSWTPVEYDTGLPGHKTTTRGLQADTTNGTATFRLNLPPFTNFITLRGATSPNAQPFNVTVDPPVANWNASTSHTTNSTFLAPSNLFSWKIDPTNLTTVTLHAGNGTVFWGINYWTEAQIQNGTA